MIHSAINKLAVNIDSLVPHPRNVREGDVGAISESLKHNGQYRPIVVQKSTNHILAGNHTWKAAKALGWDKIAVTYVDVDDESGLRILLADNKTNDLASYDNGALIELLKELNESEQGLVGSVYDGDDIDELLSDLQNSYDQDDSNELSGNKINIDEKYEVIIECENEFQQTMLLEKLSLEGLRVKALVL
jgi:hypothetical protein